MRKQWKPGPFLLAVSGLGTRLLVYILRGPWAMVGSTIHRVLMVPAKLKLPLKVQNSKLKLSSRQQKIDLWSVTFNWNSDFTLVVAFCNDSYRQCFCNSYCACVVARLTLYPRFSWLGFMKAACIVSSICPPW